MSSTYRGIFPWIFVVGMVGTAAVFVPLSAVEFLLPKTLFLGVAAVAGLFICMREGSGEITVLWKTWTGRFLLAFFATVFLSLLWSVSPLLSLAGDPPRFEGALSYVLFFALAVIGAVLGQEEEGRGLILKTLAWSAVPVIIYGMMQVLRLDPLSIAWHEELFLGRVFSTLGHPNFLGQFLLLTLPFTALRAREKGREWRIHWLVMCFLGVIVLTATGSRAAFLGLSVMIVLGGMIVGVRRRHESGFASRGDKPVVSEAKPRIAVTLMAVAITIVALAVGGAAIVRRMSVPTQTMGLGARGAIWEMAGRMITARPQGYGLETVASVSPAFLPADIARFESLTVQIDRAHSKPLDLLLTLGPLGLVTYYGFLILLFRHLWRRRKDNPNVAALLALAGGSAALFFGFDVIPTHAFFWLIAGMGMAAHGSRGREWFDGVYPERNRRAHHRWPPLYTEKSRQSALLPILTIASVTVTLIMTVWLSARFLLQQGDDAFVRGDLSGSVQATARASVRFPPDREVTVRAAERMLDGLPLAPDAAVRGAMEEVMEGELARLRHLLPAQDATVPLLRARQAALRGDGATVTSSVNAAITLWPRSVTAFRIAIAAERLVGQQQRADALSRRLVTLLPGGWQGKEDPRMRILWKENPWLEELLPYATGSR